MKKERRSTIILIALIIAAVLSASISAGMVFHDLVLVPAQATQSVKEIREIAKVSTKPEKERHKTSGKKKKEEKASAADEEIDFSVLQKEVNPDIIGWIQIPNTVIDYPVLQSGKENPEYYLFRDYKKQETKYGSIFLNAANTISKNKSTSKSLTLYGHHMNDGSMFGELLRYGELEFYKSAPVITFDTHREKGKWKIISIFKANTLQEQGDPFPYVREKFSDEEDFLNFVHQVKIRSIIETGVTVNENDQLLVLSTCSYEHKDFRTVVVARKVRKGESCKVNTDIATYQTSPLYPDCWYTNSGEKPIYPEFFLQAMEQNSTDWYDGELFNLKRGR